MMNMNVALEQSALKGEKGKWLLVSHKTDETHRTCNHGISNLVRVILVNKFHIIKGPFAITAGDCQHDTSHIMTRSQHETDHNIL